MPRIRYPRRGSMQFWPRKRAQRQNVRIRSWSNVKELKPLAFAGYKVGMAHLIFVDSYKNSSSKGEEISCPITVIECPPLKIIGFKAYEKDAYGKKAVNGTLINASKHITRRIKVKKKDGNNKISDAEKNLGNLSDITLVVQTQPDLTGIGKKKPEIFEIALGSDDVKSKLDFAKSNIGRELMLKNVFRDGEIVDTHSVTKGKGTQGPVKRFGVAIRQHKAEKTKRGPATLGPWHPHHGNYTVPHAGKMGYHQRTQMNQWIMKISNEKIDPKSGWNNYGKIRNDYMLIKGSIGGPSKRMIKITAARRGNKKMQETPPEIIKVITE